MALTLLCSELYVYAKSFLFILPFCFFKQMKIGHIMLKLSYNFQLNVNHLSNCLILHEILVCRLLVKNVSQSIPCGGSDSLSLCRLSSYLLASEFS